MVVNPWCAPPRRTIPFRDFLSPRSSLQTAAQNPGWLRLGVERRKLVHGPVHRRASDVTGNPTASRST